MRKASSTAYAINTSIQSKLIEFRQLGKYLIPSEGYFVWIQKTPYEEVGFHVLLKCTGEPGPDWYYEQGWITMDGHYFSLGVTR